MARTHENEYHSITMKINGRTEETDYGFSETYTMAKQASSAAAATLGNKLAHLRARMLPFDHTIVDVTGRLVPKTRKTFPCLTAPIKGKYLPVSQRNLFGNGNIPISNITIGENGSVSVPAPITDPDSEFSVEFCDVCAFFRLQAEGDDFAIRNFHGIPGLWIGDNSGKSIPDPFEWMADPPAVVGSITAPDLFYWDNYVDFLNCLGSEFVLIRNNPDYVAGGAGDAGKRFIQASFTTCVYKKVDGSPVGKPFGLEVGRRMR